MNQKEFNLLLSEISNGIKPINQLLFECLVLIIFYYLFNTISFINKDMSNYNSSSKSHISFVYIIAFICIILDWFIWNNQIQTSLFTSILILYIIYNINKSKTISTFINIVNDSREINKINSKINNKNDNEIKNNELEQEYQKAIQQDKLNLITFIPKEIDFSNPKNNPNYTPDAYEKKLIGINELNSAYSSGIPSIHITDSQFAEQQLNFLYDSPQYKNIKQIGSDKSLDNYNEKQDKASINLSGNSSVNSSFDKSNLDLFRNPKREFLDNKWLDLKENTYNDNCKNCKGNNINNRNSMNPSSTKYTKNAICSVVQFGRELEECTNQKDSVDNKQLDKISTNKLEPIYKF